MADSVCSQSDVCARRQSVANNTHHLDWCRNSPAASRHGHATSSLLETSHRCPQHGVTWLRGESTRVGTRVQTTKLRSETPRILPNCLVSAVGQSIHAPRGIPTWRARAVCVMVSHPVSGKQCWHPPRRQAQPPPLSEIDSCSVMHSTGRSKTQKFLATHFKLLCCVLVFTFLAGPQSVAPESIFRNFAHMAAPNLQRFESATIRLERGYSQLLKEFKDSLPPLPEIQASSCPIARPAPHCAS